jgi:hypothetical protein
MGLVFGWLRSVRPTFGRIPEPALWVFDTIGGALRSLALVEAKATTSLRPEDGKPVAALMASASGYEARGFVVHRPRTSRPTLRALHPGVRGVPLAELLAFLRRRG